MAQGAARGPRMPHTRNLTVFSRGLTCACSRRARPSRELLRLCAWPVP